MGPPRDRAGVVPGASPPRVTPARKRLGAAMEFPELGEHCSWPPCQRLGEDGGDGKGWRGWQKGGDTGLGEGGAQRSRGGGGRGGRGAS